MGSAERSDGRRPDHQRPVHIQTGFQPYAEGSVLIQTGETHVICSASVQDSVPRWLQGQGRGWVTAEYGMLPRSTHTRTDREARQGRQGGRSQEIQRLIGRSLRAVTDLDAMGERAVIVDCDVLKADGGTRTAAITGGYVALCQAFMGLVSGGALDAVPLRDSVAAISAGIVHGQEMLDLAYDEDSVADSDMNVVMTGSGSLVEVQATAEAAPFSRAALERLLDMAEGGIRRLTEAQTEAIASLR